jgi:hypothetical protein
MSTIPLPERPSIEHLRKQAKTLRRDVLAGAADALALVAEHHPSRTEGMFSLDDAQLVIARRYGFASWPRLRSEVELLVRPRPAVGSPEDIHHALRHWASDLDIERCAHTGIDTALWQPLITVHRNGVRVVAWTTPAGPVFCELTPTTVTVSPVGAPLFHTRFGTWAGVAPDVPGLSLARPGHPGMIEHAVVTDGIFVLPNGFTDTGDGLQLGRRAIATLPPQAIGTIDRPRPPVDQTSPAGQRLAACIAVADAPPAVDPDQWLPGAYAELTDTEQCQLGRYGNLLAHCVIGDTRAQELHVTDLDFASIPGTTIAATKAHYGFRRRPGQGMGSDTIAVLGIVHDDRVAMITLTRPGTPDVRAVPTDGTFILTGPALHSVRDEHLPTMRLTTLDAAGAVLETLPYQRHTGRQTPLALRIDHRPGHVTPA